MRQSRCYLEAAKLVDHKKYAVPCCTAIYETANSLQAVRVFCQFFQPDYYDTIYWGNMWSEDPAERKACRVLALLFAHAMETWEPDTHQ